MSTIDFNLSRLARTVMVTAAATLPGYWLIFTHLTPEQAKPVKDAANAVFGSAFTDMLITLGHFTPPLVFIAVGIMLVLIRQRGALHGNLFDRLSVWFVPLALGVAILDPLLSWGEIGITSTLRSFYWNSRNVFDFVLPFANGMYPYDAYGLFQSHLPFVHLIETRPFGRVIISVLPFLAVYALWRQMRAPAVLSPIDGGRLSADAPVPARWDDDLPRR